MNHHTQGRPQRRGTALVAAAIGLAMLAAGCGQSPAKPSPSVSPTAPSVPNESPGTGNLSAVADGALFGGNVPLAQEAARLGRTLAIVRIYDTIGDPFPGSNSVFLARGSTVLVSLDSNGASYASIAAGQQDAAIGTFLKAVNQAAVHYHLGAIYVSFEHEPDNPKHKVLGSPAQYVQAWDHVHQLAAADHLNWNAGGRLHWVWIIIHGTFSKGRAALFWPGAGEVDGIGADGYNTYACRLAKDNGNVSAKQRAQVTPGAIFNPAISFATSHGGLPIFISEWGSDDPVASPAQPSFIHQMEAYVAANREIAAVMYWDSGGQNCSYSVNNNPASVSALASMGHSRALQGRLTTPR